MPSIEELDLLELPVLEPSFATDPLPGFAAAREWHPWLAKSAVGYLVHEYEAIKDLYFMDDHLEFATANIVEHMGARGTPWGDFTEGLMIVKQGEEHDRVRSNVAPAFTPRNVNKYRGLMRETVSKLLDEWAPRGAFDFAEFAANFPVRVMCGVIGASPDVVPPLRHALETQGMSFSMDPSILPTANAAITQLLDFADTFISERQRDGNPGAPDLLDELLAANSDGKLSDAEMRNLLVFVFAAGYDTSKNMLTFTLYEMLQRPQMWERCAEDLGYCTQVMEETLRYHSVSNVPRTVSREFTYRDVTFPVGTNLQFILTLSGRDPRAYEDAERFDPGRKAANRHLAFGRGMHICLGQFLARAQIEEGLHLMAQRLRKPKLAGEVTWRPFVGVWGIRSLPIEFEPAAVH
ncbi:cytochrome P450 [Mangrovimicrobium sediminis]|uniref:Cytochrome P450 n=1 Tax=Mangrovimicrobium sediminis TaxID=2562682 RepID=A0A4Z0LYK6_9GAMM|nr:cytochrome P450 [Haliea sp. SAOS-164]TGD72304.1 cytochrome P450 [Haliea sp. SAOS-164]